MLFVKCISVGAMCSNCYIVYSGKNAVVIDPGDNGKLICDTANDLNVNIKHIILTHAHFDHIGAVQFVKDRFNCDVYINCNDAELLTSPSLNLSLRFGRPVCYNGDVILVNEQTENLIGFDFTFIHTPGHTPGSMCVKVCDYLFTGDTLFKCSIGNAFAPYGDTALEILSIKNKLLVLDDSLKCYPGHERPTTIAYEKKFNPYLA